jgi:SAM-dependent methyltransferase
MLYVQKVRLLKTWRGERLWRRLRTWRGGTLGDVGDLSSYVTAHAPGRSFVDVGCMWGVNGRYTFLAEEVGATAVKGVDVFGPTPEFEEARAERKSSVEFILGDISQADTIARVGVCDVVFCSGVLYHHPSPFDLLVALRRICGSRLVLRTATIPEVRGLVNAAVYWPMLPPDQRKLWTLDRTHGTQVGLSVEYAPEEGYGNWFWGLTPSCVRSLLETAGFRIVEQAEEPFAQTFVCEPVDVPFAHRLPGEEEARRIGAEVSADMRRPP